MKDSSKESLTIHKTSDYSKFKLFKSNRPVRQNKLLEHDIIHSDKLKFHPITVTKDFEIIDGQHRFSVCKKHNIPLYYVIDGDSDEKDIMNVQSAKTWTINDYLHFYCVKGEKNYLLIKEMTEKYKISVTCFVWMFFGANHIKNLDKFRSGDIETLWNEIEIEQLLSHYVEARDFCKISCSKMRFSKDFERGLMLAVRDVIYSKVGRMEKFMLRLRKNPSILEKAIFFRGTDNIRNILVEEIYNKGCTSLRI